ncbi:probable ATP-dependent RNA helicase spindle-E isoform X2 [Sitodiplosis mosellana]|uniref:probable ATP-dependent RNA helicase spindle-E isoform X2 n=1 Tax=Sitodiplosis mosellana TaxID=263140 RepID=UPI00244481F5|nr:probable ATP-dependent RNA helicase spindle-E isoform X2 [Sitodiplosis mosellana]
MDVFEFFNQNKPLVRKTISGGTTNGRVVANEPRPSNRRDDYSGSTEYAEEHIMENKRQMAERFDNWSSDEENDDTHAMDQIYATFNFNRPNSVYPITHYRSRILSAIKDNPFVVLEGPTACGKTTQVPQFIIDEAYKEKKYCNIIIAQPRRIAAASNAERVANERNWPVGTIVGYQIGFDEKKNLSNDTRILFCTTGILLEKLIRTKNFGNYTHIILDEVHERNKEMDFLFVVLKKLFVSALTRPKVKIVIMSATIQADRFSEYFSFPRRGHMQPAPIVTITEKSKYKIGEFYLEDFYTAAPKIDYNHLDKTNPCIPEDLYKIALYLINCFDDIDKKEMPEECQHAEWPTVLVFLPGIHEIIQMDNILTDQWRSVTRIETIVLHSMSDAKQRSLAFRKAASNTRKVILATNIAESSITVPDVKYVLDFCRTRIMMTDTITNFSALQLTWAARSSCIQRAGRTGRVMNGRCYRFVENHFYYNVMNENAIPELVSSPLENVILKAKLLEMGPPTSILALAMDRPQLNDIANTILILKEIGALLKTCNGETNDMDGDISFIGRIMANLPIDVKIAKFIILGYCFSILDECIVIGAALNSRSIFRDNYKARDNMRLYSQQLRWANSSGSDLVAMLHAYNAWSYSHNHSMFGESTTRVARERMKRTEREWADKFCLDIDALHECHVQVNEIKRRLERMKIKSGVGLNYVQWNDNEKAIILKVVIAGGFYPNFFARTLLNIDDYAKLAFQSIGTRDPRNTVYYTGFDRDHIRCLYAKPIKRIFIDNGIVPNERNVQVNFDFGSNKTFITFKNDEDDYSYENGIELMPGKVCTEVYKSLKMRDLRINTEFWIMKSRSDEEEYANGHDITYEGDSPQKPSKTAYASVCIPRILDEFMKGFITHIEACNQFWFQPETEWYKVSEFETYLRNYRKEVLEPLSIDTESLIGQLIIVSIDACSGITYHRAKILAFNAELCRVRLIDTGKVLECNTECIYRYCGRLRTFFDLPPRCFECRLAQMQPSQIRYPSGNWPIEAITLFRNKTEQRTIEIEVYSVTNGKANVFVHVDSKENLNDMLIHEQFGEFVEEDYISNYNHLMRKSQMECQLTSQNFDNFLDPMCESYFLEESLSDIDPPTFEKMKNKKMIKLKGPYSSLSIEPIGLTEATRNAKVVIDRHSVNSVMLENDPQDITEKYLVAATICYTDPNKRNINLRYTTQMPNIRGFGPLMALIFSPTMHVKCNKDKTHYTALRTGLGYNSAKGRPMFAEHDMVFNLNVEITQHDIELVNQIRYCLDTLLLTYPGQEEANQLSENTKREILLKIKSVIVELLERPRQCINTEITEFQWDPNFTNSPDFVVSHANDIYGHRAIFPMHSTLKTQSSYDTDGDFLRLHCKQLHDLTQFVVNLPKTVQCRLCNTKVDNIADLKMHLVSRLHCDNEKRIEFTK